MVCRRERRVRATSVRAARAVNAEVILLYWSVGNEIIDRQERLGWGGKVIPRLAADLGREFPDQKGWSPRNLQYMRAMAEAWRDRPDFVPQVVAQMPWGHVRTLLDRLATADDRDWYAMKAVEPWMVSGRPLVPDRLRAVGSRRRGAFQLPANPRPSGF